MEAGEENSEHVTLKRQRAPLSDSEDNFLSTSEGNDSQKRRRLEAAGRENRSPRPSTSGRQAELQAKADTPMVPSVRSRVQQLTQRREGVPPLAQRCLSDPGANSPSLIYYENNFREHLLSEGEFHQRQERFKVPVFTASGTPTPSPAKPCTQTSSNFVTGIHQKLQGATTPSSKQASRIRQEREKELNQLPFQPISQNAWLKRSNSDPSLTQDDGDAAMEDGSFTEAPRSVANKPSSVGTGERAACDSKAPAASVELEGSNEGGQLQMEWKEGDGVRQEKWQHAPGEKAEKLLGSKQSQNQTVLTLSFSEDQSFSTAPLFEDPNVSQLPTVDEQNLQESTHPEQSNVNESVEDKSEVFSFEVDGTSCSEEAIDEDSRVWRYPQDKEGESILAEEHLEELCIREEGEEGCLESSRVDKGTIVVDQSEPYDILDGPPETQEHDKLRPEVEQMQPKSSSEDVFTHKEDLGQQSKESQTVNIKEEAMDLDSGTTVEQTEASPFVNVDPAPEATETENTQPEINVEEVVKSKVGTQAEPAEVEESDVVEGLTEEQASALLLELEMEEEETGNKIKGVVDGLREEGHKALGEGSSKKVSFILEPELINDLPQSESNTSTEPRAQTSMSDAELGSQDESNTAETIDQMFDEVLEYAERLEGEKVEDDDTGEHDSGIGACSGGKDKMDAEWDKEKSEEECGENKNVDSNGDELLTFPPCGILSPLSKSVEAVVTPMRLAANQESNPPSLLLTPEDSPTPTVESAPLYSIDAYRTQRQKKLPTIQSVTPRVQRRAPEKPQPQPSVNTKEKITGLNEEAGKLQTVINQTLQALSCCTDEVHGRGSLEEAEAEKLLLVSCEKRSALLAEVARLREERSSESGEAVVEDGDYVSQQPCRGTVSITKIQLPLKVEFVCTSHKRAGRPSHYFFILIRYGPCNIVATPLATAADAQKGDTISFPTSVTLSDIRSSFEIDVEVYSLSHTSGSNCPMDKTTTKSRLTPKKPRRLLNSITRTSNSLTSSAPPALNTRRSSNFCLVGSHKISLASLGHSKFPLDKMKLEGKIRKLLGDEFQEKVPFLSPLEGNIYLHLDSESHSNVQHQGFLAMFELIGGYGVWHRQYVVMEGCNMYYWNHPNDREAKAAEGSISLSSSSSQCVRPVKRDSCARPFTFELVSNMAQPQQAYSQEALAKCWFSADTKQERLDWMEKLSQALLDLHTWNGTESQQANTSSTGNSRESIL